MSTDEQRAAERAVRRAEYQAEQARIDALREARLQEIVSFLSRRGLSAAEAVDRVLRPLLELQLLEGSVLRLIEVDHDEERARINAEYDEKAAERDARAAERDARETADSDTVYSEPRRFSVVVTDRVASHEFVMARSVAEAKAIGWAHYEALSPAEWGEKIEPTVDGEADVWAELDEEADENPDPH